MNVLFFGTPDFALPGLQALVEAAEFNVTCVVTQPDRPAGRGGRLKASPIKHFALEHAIPVLQPDRLRKNSAEFCKEASRFGPFRVGVVIAFGQILPQEILDLPERGCVNVHASLLPRWRGAAPIQRALLAGDNETGVCLMQMDAGLDTGPVFSREALKISKSETGQTLHDKLAKLGGELLTRDLRKIVDTQIASQAQSTDGITYADKIVDSDKRIDWSQPAASIERQIRALSPYPSAYTHLTGKRLKILEAGLTSQDCSQAPGVVLRADSGSLEVATGTCALTLAKVQLEGKRLMSSEEFLRGHQIKAGTVLG